MSTLCWSSIHATEAVWVGFDCGTCTFDEITELIKISGRKIHSYYYAVNIFVVNSSNRVIRNGWWQMLTHLLPQYWDSGPFILFIGHVYHKNYGRSLFGWHLYCLKYAVKNLKTFANVESHSLLRVVKSGVKLNG